MWKPQLEIQCVTTATYSQLTLVRLHRLEYAVDKFWLFSNQKQGHGSVKAEKEKKNAGH